MSTLSSNKLGKALYKNRQCYELELNKRLDPIEREKTRVSHNLDYASHIFLRNRREQREKWIEHDKKYGEFYRTKCHSSTKKFNKFFWS